VDSAVDRLTVTTVVENYVDMLLPDQGDARRLGLIHHFDPRRLPPRAENGISFLVTTERAGRTRSVLFDTSLTAETLLYNLNVIGASPGDLSAVVISHGHPDHHGGLLGLLEAVPHPLPIILHPLAFAPRWLRLPTGEVAPHYNYALTASAIEARGGVVMPSEGPVEVIDGVFSTGPIERQLPFEKPGSPGNLDPGLFHLIDGRLVPDTVPDDQAVCVNVAGLGLVVLTGCSHAGVINTVAAAKRITGVDKVHAVMGGFHLGFPGTPESKTDQTIAAMRDIDPVLVAPMHCTGFKAASRFSTEMPDRFLLNVSGTTVVFARN
jgi:7,8-dihydropterin-6-yl-methyl-4-(beta-D-ribofuranosyl)aminobenzene 5'-phosphate synthase